MSLPSKTSSLQTYHLALFRAAIHPEFFQIEGRSCIKHGAYEFEAWILRVVCSIMFIRDVRAAT